MHDQTFHTLIKQIDHVLNALYQAAESSECEKFKTRIFKLIQSVVSFDSIGWSRLSVEQRQKGLYSVRDSGQFNKNKSLTEANNDKQTVITRGAHGVELSSVCADLVHTLTISRSDGTHFDEREISQLKLLFPHVVQAFEINALNANPIYWTDSGAYWAFVNNNNKLIETTQEFSLLAQQAGLLRDHLFDIALLNTQPLLLNGISVEFWKLARGYKVKLQQIACLDKLPYRKRQICQYLVKGLSDKQIGRQLNISPSTVSNHLKYIYKNIEVTSRPEAIALIANTGVRCHD